LEGGVGDVGVGVGVGGKAEGVGSEVAAGGGVVVALVVVVQAGLGVGLLARESQRSRAAARVPQGATTAPGLSRLPERSLR
jgi:hypothetical protein